MIIPIVVNGMELNFILDTGVSRTILFSLNQIDSLNLKDFKRIKIRGLGANKPVHALLSKNNEFQLKNLIGLQQNLLFILDSDFDLSAKMGLTIHGIIGYDLFKDFIVEINYSQKKITFHKHTKRLTRKVMKMEKIPLTFYNKKPYVQVEIQLKKEQDPFLVKLLIDSGGSDGIWLFEGSHPLIISPEHYFDDYLGEGLSGIIRGKRSKIHRIFMGDFSLKNPTVSYPDSTAIMVARKQVDRNGSIGGMVLNRFKVFLDYKNSSMYLKKGRNFKVPFNYNMSGIELIHSGLVLVKEKGSSLGAGINLESTNRAANSLQLEYNYTFAFKPTYRIFSIRKNSPADLAGLREGDLLLAINGRAAYHYKMDEIVHLFYHKPNRKFKIKVNRNGVELVCSFKLRKVI
ncbi:MAG: aspartyl protease family protein [Flavobacteriaceae bacterium]|nr:aspartyl protease family protein [Flavobacteriaceae bacterium]